MVKLHRFTKQWLNTKAAFLAEVLERSENGEKVLDAMKREWPTVRGHPRPRKFKSKVLAVPVYEVPEGYWQRLAEERRRKTI